MSWIELGAPFEAAVVRMTLGRPGNARATTRVRGWSGRRHGSAFEEFGATGWAERAVQAPTASAGRATTAPRVVTGSVFRCAGDTRTVSFDGRTALIRDLLGLRYLERLLAEPNREFHALDLVAVERGSLPVTPRHVDSDAGVRPDSGHAGSHLDGQAREAYRRRLLEIDEDIEDATRANDLGRIELAQTDRTFLVNELSRAVGLGGRPRLAASTAERARTSVTRSIRYALARISEHHSALAEHLRQAVSTGTYCVYRPDPRLPIRWDV